MSRRFDRFAGLIFFSIGLGFVVESRNISETTYGSNVGPDVFPLGLGLILMLLSIRLFYETFRYASSDAHSSSLDYKRFFVILGAAVFYAYFLEDIGYVIGTFLFLLIGFQMMEKGKWISSILISGLFSISVYVLFVTVLQGSLPGLPTWLGF
jgi:putative tricarboxylic transport membrane protein